LYVSPLPLPSENILNIKFCSEDFSPLGEMLREQRRTKVLTTNSITIIGLHRITDSDFSFHRI